MLIDKIFYQEEVRCDYLVNEKMKKIWAVQLDLLNKLLEVCQKHDIKVFAFAGTLLGAVRHKGFIPWDDDVDVCMERKEYERFLEVCKDEFPHPYFLQTALTDKRHFCGYARLRNSNTTGIICLHKTSAYNCGIYIDIFVLDGYVGNNLKFKLQMHKKRVIETLSKAYNYDSVLRNTYGNYMEFPPVEKRGNWHGSSITYEPDIPYKEYMTKERGYLDD